MKKSPIIVDSLLAIVLLLSIAAIWWITDGLDGTEFSGGYITGRLLDGAFIGIITYMISLVTLYWLPRVSAAFSLAASACCLPLLLYFFAPRPFRWAIHLTLPAVDWSTPVFQAVVWSRFTVLPLLAVLGTIGIAVSMLTSTHGWRNR